MKKLVILLLILGILIAGCSPANKAAGGSQTTINDAEAIDFTDVETDELIDEIESRDYSVYESPEDALEDIDDDTLVEELMNRSYSVYQDPAEALDDIDEADLVDAVQAAGYEVVGY